MIICPFSQLRRYSAVIPGLEEAISVIEKIDSLEPATYPLSCGKVMVQKGTAKPLAGAALEAHRQYLDIQYILEGQEVVGWAPVDTLTPDGDFNTEKDCGMYTGSCTPITVKAGYCYVVYPEDAHAPGKYLECANDYTKMVVKLAL